MEDEQRQRPRTGAVESPSVGGNAQALHDQLVDAERQVEALQKPVRGPSQCSFLHLGDPLSQSRRAPAGVYGSQLAEAKREFQEIVMLQDDFVKVLLASMVEVMNQVEVPLTFGTSTLRWGVFTCSHFGLTSAGGSRRRPTLCLR